MSHFWETIWFGVGYLSLIASLATLLTVIKASLDLYDKANYSLKSYIKGLYPLYKAKISLIPLLAFFFVLDKPYMPLLLLIYLGVYLFFSLKKMQRGVLKSGGIVYRLLFLLAVIFIFGGTLLLVYLPLNIWSLIVLFIILSPLIFLLALIILYPLELLLKKITKVK